MLFICGEPLDSKVAAALELLRKERNMNKQQSRPFSFSPYTGTCLRLPRRTLAEESRAINPDVNWTFNPWTGAKRDPRDVDSDPRGHLIIPPGEPIYATCDCRNCGPVCRLKLDQQGPDTSGVHFIAEVPVGAKLLAFNDQIVVVAPGLAPHFVTLTGLTPVPRADGKEQ